MNEAIMINIIVFGRHEKEIRDTATPKQLAHLYKLMTVNSVYIEQGISYQERKALLSEIA